MRSFSMSKCEGNFCRVRRKLGEMKSFSLNSRCACAFKSLQFIIESQCCKEHFYLSETCVFGLVRVTFFEIIVVLWIDISWFSYHHLTCRQISSIHLKLLIRAINNKKISTKNPTSHEIDYYHYIIGQSVHEPKK